MDYRKASVEILKLIGGKENIANMSHCATRLRFNLKDDSLAKLDEIEKVDGVASAVNKAGQCQIIIGLNVGKVYSELENLLGNISSDNLEQTNDEKTGIASRVFAAISGIFAPLLPVMAGSGILRGLVLLAVQFGLLSQDSGTYKILTVISMSIFYFLPIMLAFTTAKRFKTNQYISAIIAASLLHPDFIGLMGTIGNGAKSEFMGIPVVLMNYSATVVPIIFSIFIYSYLGRFLEKHIKWGLEQVLVPLLSLLIMVPVTIIIIGPIGVYGSEYIAGIINAAIESNGLLAGILVGGGWSVLVSFGVHWAVNPIMINSISTRGYDYICPLTFACNFAVIGTALGVVLKTKNEKIRNFNFTGIVTILLSGIIEPTLYGTLVRNKKYFLSQIIGGAVGGAFMGLSKVSSSAFVFGGGTTLPALAAGNFKAAIIGLTISVIVSGVLAYIFTTEE